MKYTVQAACPHDCPDACGVLITVQQGRAIKIQGDPAHPITQGFLCAKVAKYLDRVYSPDRVLYPMKRIAAKGPVKRHNGAGDSSAFVRISWDEALDSIAAQLKEISAKYGPEAILPYSYGGTLGVLGNASMDRRFFHRLGASQLDRTICSEAGAEGLKSVLGIKYGTEPEQFEHSRYIIAWGANIHGNNIHLWPFIERARRKGAKLVVIDPYKTRTARVADWHIAINPGTDAALALGMLHVIIAEHLYDEPYVENYTLGFEQLRERVRDYPPERVSQWTGLPAEEIVQLAREYATTVPAVIRANYGLQRCDNGGMAMRTIAMLPCVTGSWRHVGGGLQLTTSGAFKFDKNALQRSDLMLQSPLHRSARSINMSELGKALTEVVALPVKALFVYNSNPAAVTPDRSSVIRGLLRPDLFTVVHDQFLTDTCDYADIVLPATTFFEHTDLVPSYGHYYLRLSPAAIEPLGECKSNTELFRVLADRMGFEERCFQDTDEQMIDAALSSDDPQLAGISRQQLEDAPQIRLKLAGSPDDANAPFLPFAEGHFGTPSGKAEFYSEGLKQLGLDPVAAFTPPLESRHTNQERQYPLELLARKADQFVNTTFGNLERHREFAAQVDAKKYASSAHPLLPRLEINSVDANLRGIRNGDRVRVFNARGEIYLVAEVTDSTQPGVVAAQLFWAKLAPDGQNINVLTSSRLTDMGGGPTFYSALVDVKRAESLP